MSQPRHTLVLDRRSWLVRYIAWCWEDDLSGISFCLLFWGFVASPAALVAKALRPVFRRARVGVRGLRGSRSLEVLSSVADRGAEFGQAHPSVGKWLGRALVVGMFLYVVGFLAYALYQAAWWALLIPANVAWVMVGLWHIGALEEAGRFLSAGYHATKDRTCPDIQIVEEHQP